MSQRETRGLAFPAGSPPARPGRAGGQDGGTAPVPDGVVEPHAGSSTPGQIPPSSTRPGWRWRSPVRPWVQEIMVLAGLLAAGVAACWPRATFIAGRLPMDAKQAPLDVWSLWWVARQLTHLGSPWLTYHLAAPVGVHLGLDTLMPLVGAVMAPVTLIFGPSAAFNLLGIVTPGLAAYAMYRAARLWLPGRIGPIAAGAFFGFSAMLASQDWQHLHTAIGAAFLPLTLEVAVRLRRDPNWWRAVLLGLAVGASMLVDQETSVMAVLLAVFALLPWLVRQRSAAKLRAAAIGAVTAVVVAGPQLLAIMQAAGPNGPRPPGEANYVNFAAQLPSLFAPSPRLAHYGLTGLASVYRSHRSFEMISTFGVVVTVLAVLGIIVSWRRSGTKRLALLWLGCALVALGPTLYLGARQFVPLGTTWHGLRVSLAMPYTWLIRLPGFVKFREADRFALLGLVGAAMLAGAAVHWLRRHAWQLVIVVAVLGAFEAGWQGDPGQPVMPTALPAVDGPIAADHSGSVVVDVPFVVRGPQVFGSAVSPFPLVLATADGHPRAMSYTAMVPRRTILGIKAHPFYSGLVAAQRGRAPRPGQLSLARQDLRNLDVGWVLVWPPRWALATTPVAKRPDQHYSIIRQYLRATGFVLDYTANGVSVYRPRPGR